MNPDLSAPLTHEEFVSLRDCAKDLVHRTIPAEHKDRLIQLGYVQELSGGLRLTNAGRLRIAEALESIHKQSRKSALKRSLRR